MNITDNNLQQFLDRLKIKSLNEMQTGRTGCCNKGKTIDVLLIIRDGLGENTGIFTADLECS